MGSTVVVAPDSFKGTATAAEAARAIGHGWLSVRPDDRVRYAPMADGGEGTVDAFLSARSGSKLHPITVTGPDGRRANATWVSSVDDDGARTAVIEVANTSGITLLRELLPLDAHTRGFGQAIRAALDWGAERLLLGLGGSSSTDGGAGALRELGYRFLDGNDDDVPDGNRGLASIVRVDARAATPLPADGAIVLSDVTNPLLGPDGAVAVFGRQKGITAETAETAEAGLGRLAEMLDAVRPGASTMPGSGAAGGAGFGLTVWGARCRPGAAAVADQIGLRAALMGSDLVITGEGRFDAQTAGGKVPHLVAARAAEAGLAVALVAGVIEAPTDDYVSATSLSELAGSRRRARDEARTWLNRAGAELARQWKRG